MQRPQSRIFVIAVIVPAVNLYRRSFGRLALALMTPLLAAQVAALDQIEIVLGDLQGTGWQAQDIRLRIELVADGQRGAIAVAALRLPEPIGAVQAVQFHCDELQLDAAGTRCKGRVEVARIMDEALSADMQLTHEAASGALRLQLRELSLAGGRWQIDAHSGAAGAWSVAVQGRQVEGAALQALLQTFAPTFEYSLSGVLNLMAEISGDAASGTAVRVELASEALDFSNPSGTQAGERLDFALSGRGRFAGDDWSGEAQLACAGGALFVDPLYLEFTPDAALRLNSDLQWAAAAGRLHLNSLQLDHAGVAQAQADVELQLADTISLQALALDLRDAQLPAAYLSYLQPWLHGKLGDALETAGRFSGQYRYRADGETALRLDLQNLDIVDAGERFGFVNLSGVIDWGSDASARTTELRWDSGSLYRLALGAADVAVVSRGTDFELREPTRIPVLDGLLLIDQLSLREPGDENMRWRFDGVLTPVSMEAVSTALGWPKFGGRLSGMVPTVQYAEGALEVGGVLLVRAFDGDLTVRNLRLEQPFGRIPRLSADLALDNLDLDALTRTFEFGKIEGRLSGHVNRLYMEAWEPVAFEARFETPADDDSRHRISQKAVDNLSSLGGGVGGALSRTFLGVFEEFPYDRLGLSCVLENGVCHMGGVAPAANGYYIVKGRFVPPRLDVVGYADRVDWHTLIDRLKAVTLDQAPVVR